MTTIITAGLILFVLVGFIAMIIVQTRHKNAVRKRERLIQLSTQIKKLQNILRSLPPHFLTPELKDFIFDTIIYNYQKSIEMNPSNVKYLKSDLEQVTIQRQQHKQQKPNTTTSPIMDSNKANLARSTLKALHGFLIDSYKAKRINGKIAEKLIHHTEYKLLETAIEFFVTKAESGLANHNFNEARGLYQKAADTISKSKHKANFQQELIAYHNRAKEIQVQWREHNSAMNQGRDKQQSEDFDKWDKEQDEWKVRHDYD